MKLEDAKPKTIENGVTVPARLQINEEGLSQHQLRRQMCEGKLPMTREEAEAAGFGPQEIARYFG